LYAFGIQNPSRNRNVPVHVPNRGAQTFAHETVDGSQRPEAAAHHVKSLRQRWAMDVHPLWCQTLQPLRHGCLALHRHPLCTILDAWRDHSVRPGIQIAGQVHGEQGPVSLNALDSYIAAMQTDHCRHEVEASANDPRDVAAAEVALNNPVCSRRSLSGISDRDPALTSCLTTICA
jgi:hypothetical protein